MPASLPQTAPGIPAPNVDPLPNELEAIKGLVDIGKWLGADTALLTALASAIGSAEPKLRDIVYISQPDWDDMVKNMSIPTSESESRSLKPIERAHVGMVRRIARLRLALPAVDMPAPTTVANAMGSHPSTHGGADTQQSALASTTDASVKLSAVWDPTLDTILARMAPQRFRKLFATYKEKRGAEPVEEIEPTLEQVSACEQVLGSDKSPYADFAVLGPYGRRLLQKLLYTVWHFQPDGTWQRQELPGPPSWEFWWASYKVLRCTFLLLDVASPEMLDN